MRSARWIRLIGIWQMAGGVITAITFLDAIRALPAGKPLDVVIVLCAVTIAIATAVVGYGLYRGRAAALAPSMIAQVLQVVAFNIGGTVYQLTLGPYLYFTVVFGERVTVGVGFMPRMLFALSAVGPSTAAVNLLALWCFWKLLWTEPHQLLDHRDARTSPPPESAAAEPPPVSPLGDAIEQSRG
ncbi:MAG TPA: hypothetical protein VFK13_08740 [Gemmatimonadaceae bacterium]|nr:hypothetical protein [Gemmatimonadaceae bacterium]